MIQLADSRIGNTASVSQVCHSSETLENRISGLTEEQLHQLNALLTSRIAGLNAFSGDSSRKKDAEGLHCLTVREQEVLTLIASGYTRPEVAAALGVTRNTAATHIASIYRKLDIGSIAEATMLAVRWGVLG